MNLTQEKALQQIVEYKPTGIFKTPVDGYVYKWWLVKVSLSTLTSLRKSGYLEARQSDKDKKVFFDYCVRPSAKGWQYGKSKGWKLPINDMEEARHRADPAEAVRYMMDVQRIINMKQETLKEELKLGMVERQLTRHQFNLNSVEDLTYLWKFGSELVPGDIMYNEGYGTWDIIIGVDDCRLLLRSYVRNTFTVQGVTRRETVVSTAEYKLLFNEPPGFMYIDWRGHRTGLSRQIVKL